MQNTMSIITPAGDDSLITVYEARLGLNLFSTTEMTDDQIEMFIRFASDEIAVLCNRVLAKEEVKETIREIDSRCNRLFLSHYPVGEITSITENGKLLTPDVDYELDDESGRLTRISTNSWIEPVVVIYTGGYDLPIEAPSCLRQAALLLTREAYMAAIRGDNTIRMVSHKESRIIYFDPNAKLGLAAKSGTPARRAIDDLLKSFTRFWV